eukprot:6206981-Pleurochrysis_carterae.AAC.3
MSQYGAVFKPKLTVTSNTIVIHTQSNESECDDPSRAWNQAVSQTADLTRLATMLAALARNFFTSGAIAACRRGREWQRAITLFDEFRTSASPQEPRSVQMDEIWLIQHS